MKPRLRKFMGLWYCGQSRAANPSSARACGIGYTPKAAYDDWWLEYSKISFLYPRSGGSAE
jgi:hypothetical protein